MKKIAMLIIIPYLLLMAVIFYFYFGPGLMSSYQPLKWNGIETNVPGDFKVKIYQSKGWEVYSMKNLFVFIKIARKPTIDVSDLPHYSPRVVYKYSPEPDSIYYIANPHKNYEVIYARNMGDVTLYFSVSSASVFSGSTILEKLTADCYYNGKKITMPEPSIPLEAYITDFIFLGGMTLPLIIILLIFYFSGRKPAEKYFTGDPIRFEESYVYFKSVRKYRRKSSFCYLVLTTTRLMVFLFGKPIWESRLDQEKPDIRIEGKKIIIRKEKEKMVLKPSEIDKWHSALSSFLY